MDSFEDFDFKPITKGLGFDKAVEDKKVDIEVETTVSTDIEDVVVGTKKPALSAIDEIAFSFGEGQDFDAEDILQAEVPTSKSIADMVGALPPNMDSVQPEPVAAAVPLNIGPKIFQPVGREMPKSGLGTPPSPKDYPMVGDTLVEPPQVDISLDNSMSEAFPKMELHKKKFFHQTVAPQPQFSAVAGKFTSGILDLFVVAGIGALFIVALVVLTGTDLFEAMAHTEMARSTLTEIGVLLFCVYLLYYMVSRSLFGSTLGDWAFDLQLGSETQRSSHRYPFQVLLRMLVIGITGFIVLPIISTFTKKDMAEKFSGLRLFVRNY